MLAKSIYSQLQNPRGVKNIMSIEICMPKYGMSMEEGEVVNWFKKEGDVVKKGDEIAEIMESKANHTLEALESGTLEKIVVHEGEVALVGAVIAYLSE